jgi:excisionase family DNA binding protein
VINGGGLIYTVEEVSDLLGIPRPTLYRYLREYSIPHLRRAGRISIPEESFDRIREARDLHKEGLGTESVRRLLRERHSGQDTGELKERLERLSETLERLRRNGSTTTDEAFPSHALRTVLARQSLIMSAMFNLTEMVEELLLASGKPRKAVFEDVEGEIREVAPLLERTETLEEVPATAKSALPSITVRRKKFGSLARRRRRSFLVLLSALLVGVILMWALPTLGGELASGLSFLDGRKAEESSPSSQERQAAHNPSAGDETSDAMVGSGTSGSEEGRRVEVPDVSGQGVVEAARILSRAGLKVAAIKTVTSEEEAGTMTRTVPPAGSVVGAGTPVVLIMSGGPTGIPPGLRSENSHNGAADQYGN